MLTRPFPLDMVPGGVPLYIHVSQYDSDEQLTLSLFSSQGRLSVPTSGVSASIRGTKLDGNGIQNSCSLTFSGDVPIVTVQLTKQMTAIAGNNPFEIVLTAVDMSGDYYELPSSTFFLAVKPAAMDYDTVQSDSDIMEVIDVMAKADQLISAAENIKEAAEEIKKGGYAGEEELEALEHRVDVLESDMNGVRASLATKVDGGFVSETEQALYLTSGNTVVAGPFSGFGGGGGGGGGSDSTLTVTNTTGWTSTTISQNGACTLRLNWSSIEDELPTGDGTLSVYVNDTLKASINVAQGNVSVEVSGYLSTGANTVRLTIMDSTGNSKSRNFTITVVALYMTSSFDDTVIQSGTATFPYIPYGAISKTVHFVIDGVEAGTVVTTVSGRQLTWTIPTQTHGSHTLRVYMTATINGTVVSSDSLFYDIIWIVGSNTTPVIAVSYNVSSVDQYSTVNIPYLVYTPESQTSEVTISVGGTVVSSVTVDRTQQTFSCRMNSVGSQVITFATGSVMKSISLTVNELDVDVEAETESLVLYLSSTGRSNREENPARWTYDGISCTFQGFNWTSNGWIADADGIVALKLSGDARLTIPYRMFERDFRTTGQTIEIDFSTQDVMDYDAVVLSCMYGGRGLTITPQSCRISSEQTTLSMQYKEEEHVRVSFVIEKSSTGYRRMYAYIDGVMSGVIQYAADDDFSQSSPVYISVGSSLATINLYTIRVYDNDLTAEQMTNNWIADTQDGSLLVQRYARNHIYDEYGSIVINQLPSDLPYMVIECAELPQYKGDKKTVSGRYVDPLNPTKSFTFSNCQANVQGTSSQYYARKNYTLKFNGGFVLSNGQTVSKYAIRSDSIPVKEFCMKADVASSEGANNVELVRLYCNACPYETPAQESDPKVRQGIDGFPIVIFWYDTVNETTTFLGKYNFNNSKGTEEVYGFAEGDESWEILNNTSDLVLWKSDDYTSTTTDDSGNVTPNWYNDFEARFPDTDPPYVDCAQLQEFSTWVKSTDPEQATNEPLSPPVTYDGVTYRTDTDLYRKAKFRAELGNYVELDSALFYYLFTELFLMVDSRAKNMFPSFIGTEIEEES